MSVKTKWTHHVSMLLIILCLIGILLSSVAGSIHPAPPDGLPAKSPEVNDWWPMFHHDSTRSGLSTTSAPDTADVLWTYQTGFIISSSPAISHGRVYVGSWDKNLYCFDMDSGNLLWNYTVGSEITSSPAVVNGKVFIGSQDTYLYCLDAITGSLLWDFKAGFLIETSPAVVDDLVYFGSSDGSLYCLNTLDGDLIWEYEINSAFVSSPMVVDERLYIGIVNGDFICLNSITGNTLWTFSTTSGIYSTPTFDDGNIYFGANDENIYCLDAEDGNVIWNYSTLSEVHSSPAIAYGFLYVGTSDGRMLCLEKETGGFVWSHTILGSVESSPGVTDGKVYFVTDPCCGATSYLFCLNAYTGVLIWSYNLNTQLSTESSPALAAGKVFIGSGDGKIYAFGETIYLADANGPYYGFKDTPVKFTGSVYGGQPDYSWYWDLGDGTTSTLQNPTHTYPAVGEYIVTLTVTDGLGQVATDDTEVIIDVPNTPPETPTIDGPTTSRPAEPTEFTFTASDLNNDKVLYFIEWGDNTSTGWIGPFDSGASIHQNHSWSIRGSYEIVAKVKDWHGAESNWSAPFEFSITAPELTLAITGGIGISVMITNIGDATATIDSFNFTIDKGLILYMNIGQLPLNILPGETITEKIVLVGFGKIIAQVLVQYDEGMVVNESMQGKLFLFFVFGVH